MAFTGFPQNVRYTPVPNPLFGRLLEQIDDLDEMKCTLRIIWLAHHKKGYPRFVYLREMTSDPTLLRSLAGGSEEAAGRIESALRKAVTRGTLVTGTVIRDGVGRRLYALNTERYRRALSEVGSTDAPREQVGSGDAAAAPDERPNIFSLYEDNIGMLNPMIAEQLKEAEESYPKEWIDDAFREAVSSNVRNWRYVSKILERWEQDGRTDGGLGRHPEEAGYQKYFRR